MVTSDSMITADLDECDFSEHIENRVLTGSFAGPVININSGYLPCTGAGIVDTHAITNPWPTPGAGTVIQEQTFTFRDRRMGVNDVPVLHSGFRIVHELALRTGGRIHSVSKRAFDTTANGFPAQSGTVLPGANTAPPGPTIKVTQNVP